METRFDCFFMCFSPLCMNTAKQECVCMEFLKTIRKGHLNAVPAGL